MTKMTQINHQPYAVLALNRPAPTWNSKAGVSQLLPWLVLPTLFLPNLGVLVPTPFGTLEISDFFIWPYLAIGAVAVAFRRHRHPFPDPAARLVSGLIAFFLAWAFVSTLTMPDRYGYGNSRELIFCLLKVAKLLLYSTAGWLTIRLVVDRVGLNRLLWSLTTGALLTAAGLPFASSGVGFSVYDRVHGFKSVNAVSVEMAILIAFLGVAWSSGWGCKTWRRAFPMALVLMTLGFAFSRGRGGWVAALVGVVWYLYRSSTKKRRVLSVAAVLLVTATVSYFQIPEFRFQVDRTLNPDQAYLERYGAGIMGFDEGGRQKFWRKEAPKVIEAPILGRGLFNRFPPSGLDWVGSHNFWVQMFLETGIPGGLAVLMIWWILWREARRRGLLAVEVAILVALIGGMGGEYFYGGMPLLAAILVTAPLFSIPGLAFVQNPTFVVQTSLSLRGSRDHPSLAHARARSVVGQPPPDFP